MTEGKIQHLYGQLLSELGLHGQNFDETPKRMEQQWYNFISPPPIKLTTFTSKVQTGHVIVKNHECWSFCPHHLLPVKYIIKIGYLPKGKKVLGLSKLARICDSVMYKMPLQEELGAMIVQPLIEAVQPRAAGAVINGQHLCMRMRGVESSCAEAVTDFMWGLYLEDASARQEFLSL